MKLIDLIKVVQSDNISITLYKNEIGFGRKILTYLGDGEVLKEDILNKKVCGIWHNTNGLNITLEYKGGEE